MVGKIHPFGIWTPDLPHIPLEELVWVTWDKFHEKEHMENCVVCRNVADWTLDLIWSSWDHKTYIPYKDFIYKLIKTDEFSWYFSKVATCDMYTIKAFFYGSKPYLFEFF